MRTVNVVQLTADAVTDDAQHRDPMTAPEAGIRTES